MHNDTTEPFWFPAVGRKKVTAAFDGGRLTSDGGVMLLAAAERRIGIAHRLAGLIADPRNPLLVTHSVVDILRARMLAIACGWCEANDVDYVFGLPGNGVLSRLVEIAADDVRVRRAEAQAAVLCRYTETRYGAKSWGCERRVVARIEASTQGLDIRYVVTNLDGGSAEWL